MSGSTSQTFLPLDGHGVYRGDGTLLWAKRIEITRPSGPGPFVSGSSGPKQAFTEVTYSGNSFDRAGNFIARRPQTGGLTDAQRPIYLLEQVFSGPTQSIDYVAVFKSTDGGGSFSFVRELPANTYTSGDSGIFFIEVAPNGDVMLIGKTGVWLSQDGFTTAPTKIYPASGSREVSSGYFYGGGAATASGARIGDYVEDAKGGVWSTPNVRTTAFAKPTGAGGVGNAGLPANYRVWHLGHAPSNPNRLAVCTDGQDPYLSTDGGKNFSKITSLTATGDKDGRYNITGRKAGGHSGFLWCPADEHKVLVLTFQTMSRSVSTTGVQPDGDLVAYFNGLHGKGWGSSATDWKKVLLVAQDSFVNTGLDGLNWIQENGLGSTGHDAFMTAVANAGGGDARGLSGACGVIGPNNRVVCGVNRNTAGQSNIICILDGRNNTTGTYGSYLLKGGLGASRCTNVYWSLKDDDVAFVGRWAISNLGAASPADVVFEDHGSHEIIGRLLAGTTQISYWGDFRSGEARGDSIYRSTHDRGLNNQAAAWYTIPGGDKYFDRCICVDHHSPERILYVRNGNRNEIREVKRQGGVLVDNVLVNLRTMPGGVLDVFADEIPGGITVPAQASQVIGLLGDRHMPGLFYAIVGGQGSPNLWMTVDDGATWRNISAGIPRTLWFGHIHDLTGDLMIESSMGGQVLPPPAGYPSIPNKGALSAGLRAFFDRPAVPKPPVLA